MAQLRRDYDAIRARDAEIVVIGPEDGSTFAEAWSEEAYPFIGLADPDHEVSSAYGQQVNWLKMGRLPAAVVVDPQRRVRYRHYGNSMRDIAATDELLAVLDEIRGKDPQPSDGHQHHDEPTPREDA